ncbi:MarR family winged helix-turn-helix transcriptional regulator [Curtobacterium aetherium]|uniref:MarR family winged helix-turn-helix transcriptional regulator n=1 Tax=Curtobacterium aetherium TaxID=2841594 RepID=A0ACD1E7N0_9MICO|nr:MarR family winged helix-turn-helix transcriptional regulator [Curtobacterium sp. L6-1]QWS34855.1 MarR family winged helix-turn-helix transcriptional regulator [Curtobacterium sp. L6-1]
MADPRGPGIREADIGRAYTELSRITRRASVRARGTDDVLSVVDQSLVDFVVQHPGCMAIDIARYLRLNRSTISRQLSGLLAAGLVRTVDGGTGNAKPLEATDAGRRTLARSVQLHRDALVERLVDWSDDDVALLAGMLERLGAADEADLPMPSRPTEPTEP